MNPIIGDVLIALAVLNLVGLLLVFYRLGRVRPAPASEPTAPPVPVPDPEPTIQPDQLAGMLRRLENRLGDIEDQVRRTPTVNVATDSGATSDRTLALAQRLARQGASVQDIADTCGISYTEAELLHRLHAAR
ncbi:DUF2802 domain-containing protein [Luteibacter sp. PPL552]